MTPHVTSAVQAAAEAVVSLVQNTLDMPVSDVQGAVSAIILRHVEPIVRATRDGLVAASRDLIRERTERDQALAKLAAVEGELSATKEDRDAVADALSKANGKLIAIKTTPQHDEGTGICGHNRYWMSHYGRCMACERDQAEMREASALARAEQSEALLRIAVGDADVYQGDPGDETRQWCSELGCYLRGGVGFQNVISKEDWDRIQAHLAPKETT